MVRNHSLLLVAIISLHANDLLAADWPSWRGNGSGSAGMPAVSFVDRFSDAKQIWRSEAIPATDLRRKGRFSGYASPVVADGRVYLYYFQANQSVIDENVLKRFMQDRNPFPKATASIYASVLADDVILCLDAKSGKTLWKKVYENAAINFGGSGKSGGHYTPCVADGRVFAQGTSRKLYCLDAATGKEHWQKLHPVEGQEYQNLRDQARLKKTAIGMKKYGVGAIGINMVPCAADNVVVFGKKGSLYGYEASSGRELWQANLSVGGSKSCSPVIWRTDGKAYVLYACRTGGYCLDLQTGTKRWHISTAVSAEGTAPVAGDIWILSSAPKGPKSKVAPPYAFGFSAWRITADTAEQLWALEPQYRPFQCGSPCIHNGILYALCELNSGYVDKRYKGVIGEGFVYICVDIQSGKILHETPAKGPGRFGKNLSASLCAVGPFLFDVNINRVFRADPKHFSLLEPNGRKNNNGITSPAIVGSRIFVREDDAIACYELAR